MYTANIGYVPYMHSPYIGLNIGDLALYLAYTGNIGDLALYSPYIGKYRLNTGLNSPVFAYVGPYTVYRLYTLYLALYSPYTANTGYVPYMHRPVYTLYTVYLACIPCIYGIQADIG